jgi:hypothetical protein
MPDDSIKILLQYGLAGVGLVAEALVIRYLANELKASQERERQQMEARRVDAKESLEKVEEPLSSIAQSTKFIADKLIVAKRGDV